MKFERPYFIVLYLGWCCIFGIASDKALEGLRLMEEKDDYKRAMDLYSRKKYEEAISYLDEAINLNDSERKYYEKRAECYVALGRLKESIPDYKKLVQIRPSEENTSVYEPFNYERAEKDPLTEDRRRLIVTLFKCGEFEEVLQVLVSWSPNDFEVISQFLPGDTATSDMAVIDICNRAIEKNPNERVYYSARAYRWEKMDNLREVMADLKSAILLGPVKEDYRTRLYRERLYETASKLFNSGIYNGVVDVLVASYKNELPPYYGYKNQLRIFGDEFCPKNDEILFKEVIRMYSELMVKCPISTESYYDLYRLRGVCYMKHGDYSMARTDLLEYEQKYFQLLNIVPITDGDVLLCYEFFMQDWKVEHARNEVMNLLSSSQLVMLGNLLLRINKDSEAFNAYTTAIEKDPKNAENYDKRGYYHLKNFQIDDAIADFRKAAELEPTCASYQTHLNETLKKKEEKEEEARLKIYKTEVIEGEEYLP